ncbi:MAG: DNA primase, partial [Flavobacterium sp.]|nr:DNA primase [Flavobacterium sp.]
ETLHNWEGQNIIVKEKDHTIAQYVTETILTIRWYLVHKIIEELKSEIAQHPDADNTEPLSMAMDYYKLINTFSQKLGRVMSRYN